MSATSKAVIFVLVLCWSSVAEAQFAVDTFVDGASVQLDMHNMTGGPAGTWTKASYSPVCGGGVATPSNNADVVQAVTAGDICDYYNSLVPPDADYEVQTDIIHNTDLNHGAGVMCRQSTTARTGYYGWHAGTTNQWLLQAVVDGTDVANGTPFDQTLSNGTTYTVKLRCVGTQIQLYVDGVLRVSLTDSNITSAGRSALFLYSESAPSGTTGVNLDNFSATDVTANTDSGSPALLRGVGR